MELMELDQRFTLCGTVQDTEADGEMVLLDLEREQFYGLNEAGALVWRGLGAGLTLREIIDELSAAFDAPEERLRADVLGIVEQLTHRGWLQPRAAGA
jgi:hypothetical protein